MSDIRQEFETWYLGLHGSVKEELAIVTTKEAQEVGFLNEGDYFDLGTRSLFQGYEAAHKAQQAEIERLKERVDEWVDFATSHSAPFRAKCGHLVNRGWVCQVCGQDPTEALEGNQ